jgi:hypothetical protein
MKIRVEECEDKLTVADDKLKVIEEKLMTQRQLLDSPQWTLSK